MRLLLLWMQKHLIWSVPLATIAGFLAGQIADPDPLRWLILPPTFLVFYLMMVTMHLRQLWHA